MTIYWVYTRHGRREQMVLRTPNRLKAERARDSVEHGFIVEVEAAETFAQRTGAVAA